MHLGTRQLGTLHYKYYLPFPIGWEFLILFPTSLRHPNSISNTPPQVK